MKVTRFLLQEMEWVPLFSNKSLLEFIKYGFWWWWIIMGFHWDKSHDAFHMVSNPCSARCWENEVAWLTNQEEGRWASCCWKPTINHEHIITWEVLKVRSTKYGRLSKNTLWHKTSYVSSCSHQGHFPNQPSNNWLSWGLTSWSLCWLVANKAHQTNKVEFLYWRFTLFEFWTFQAGFHLHSVNFQFHRISSKKTLSLASGEPN